MRAIALIALAAAIASATSIKWTGIAQDNQWYNHINWYPAQVPGQNDDVTIAFGNVYVTQTTAVNSLTMGILADQTANLTLYQPFVIGAGGMTVDSSGTLIVQTGLGQVFGQVAISGNLNFVDGVLGGSWTIDRHANANLGNNNEKGFSGCTFKSKGFLSLGGVLQLNQSSTFTIESNTEADSNLAIQNGDNSAVLFDASAAKFSFSTGVLTIQAPVKLGNFQLKSGNMTILDSLTFEQSLNIPSGSYVAAYGNAVVNVSAGITGAGVISFGCKLATIYAMAMTGAVNLIGNAVVFASASSMGILTIQGSNVVISATVSPAQLNLISGTTSGSGVIAANNAWVKTNGFTLGSSVSINGTLTFAKSNFNFGMEGSLTILTGAKAVVTDAVLLTGPAFIPGFINQGQLQLTASLSSQNIDITGAGSITVATTFSVNTAKVSQSKVTLASGASFVGQHTFLTIGAVASATDGKVVAVIGAYTLSCPGECDNVSTPGATTPTSAFSFSA